MAKLSLIQRAIKTDPGLVATLSQAQLDRGVTAAGQLNDLLLGAIAATGVNRDGQVTAADMARISDYIRHRPGDLATYLAAYGVDSDGGFHKVEGAGATRLFQGHNAIDGVIDAIYHFGLAVKNGAYADGVTLAQAAGWLNYFLNGQNTIFGSAASEGIYGGASYSAYFASGQNEVILGQGGNDSLGGNVGADRVFGGTGNDQCFGDQGNDWLYGAAGNDSLIGSVGNDRCYGGADTDFFSVGAGDDWCYGGAGVDEVYGDIGDDRIYGGAGIDKLDGNDGNDRIFGGADGDLLAGNAGADRLYGNAGADSLYGGEGRDLLSGGAGADVIEIWDGSGETDVVDTVVFAPGDSGAQAAGLDTVMGFESGVDKIDLRAFGEMRFASGGFKGAGASCWFDGDYLRIDKNGDHKTDLRIEFRYLDVLKAGDFIFG